MKTYTILLGVCLILISSCKKSTIIITGDAGTWITNNTGYNAIACVGNVSGNEASLTAYTAYPETSNSSKMVITFYKKLPTTSRTYFTTATNNSPTDTNQLRIQLITNNNKDTFNCFGPTPVNIIVSEGRVQVIGSGVSLYNSNYGTQNTTLNIKQLQ